MSFIPEMSTDSICVGANTSLCLSNKLQDMDDAIKAAQSGTTVAPKLIASMHLGKLDNNNGSELASSNRICSDPFPIENGKTYWQVNDKGVNMYVLLYNADEMFVQFVGNIPSGQAISINSAAATYMRLGSLVGEYDLTNEFRIYDVDPESGGSSSGDGYSKDEADTKFAAKEHSHSDYAALVHSHAYADLTDKPSTFAPSAHKSSHLSGGSDALTAADLGAVPVGRKVNGKALSDDISLSAMDLDAVPSSRKVNGKALAGDVTLTTADLGAVPTSRTVNGQALSSDISLTATNLNAVPNTRTINGKALSADVSLSAADTGAVPSTRTVNGKTLSVDVSLSAADTGAVPSTRMVNGRALSADVSLTAADVNAVPTTRKVNGKALTSDINITAAELGAASSSHSHSASEISSGTLSSDRLPILPISKGGTGATSASSALSNLGAVGRLVAGKTVNPSPGSSVRASTGAEILNDYSNRTFFNEFGDEGNVASGLYSLAVNSGTTASGDYSFAAGNGCIASEESAHAEGFRTSAIGNYAFAAGVYTIADQQQFALGTYNVQMGTTSDNRLIVGGGAKASARFNAFRVHSSGKVYGGQYSSTGADYAEMFEWADHNTNEEDRVGRFVALDGECVRLATPQEQDILGVVSGAASLVGDVYDDQWAGMYLRDVYGRVLYEDTELPAELDPNGEVIREARTENLPKINPAYRSDETYIPRSERPEWTTVGLMGKLIVVDDGTCAVNGYCSVGDGGVATKADEKTRFRVMARLDETHIRVLIL